MPCPWSLKQAATLSAMIKRAALGLALILSGANAAWSDEPYLWVDQGVQIGTYESFIVDVIDKTGVNVPANKISEIRSLVREKLEEKGIKTASKTRRDVKSLRLQVELTWYVNPDVAARVLIPYQTASGLAARVKLVDASSGALVGDMFVSSSFGSGGLISIFAGEGVLASVSKDIANAIHQKFPAPKNGKIK